jgi:hypothetical protein
MRINPASFDARVLAHGPWSFSKIGRVEKCTKQYALKDRQKIKGDLGSAQSRIGSCVHKVFEFATAETYDLSDTSIQDPLREMLHRFAPEEEYQLTPSELRTAETMLPHVEAFVRKLSGFCTTNGVTTRYREVKLAIRPDGGATSFFDKQSLFRGVIDLALLTDRRTLVIIDHKTGGYKNVKNHVPQLYLYMLLTLSAYPEVDFVQGGIHYLGRPTEFLSAPDHTMRAWSRADVARVVAPWLPTYMNAAARRLQLVDDGQEKAELGWICEWCEYANERTCPEGLAEVKRRALKRGDAL